MRSRVLLVTGGAGFIGSNFVLQAVGRGHKVVNLDALTYAGNMDNLESLHGHASHVFVQGSILDGELVSKLLAEHKPDAVVHFAAESHVDRSIVGPRAFVDTNITGTFTLLDAALKHTRTLSEADRSSFRFLHVSTDEVYGSLGPDEAAFHEETSYKPNSPYSASKAASDHLVRAYFHTYGLPVVTTNCSNNYGPYQFPEKLIPLMIHNAINAKPLPVYGDGQNVRDWLYVTDHCDAILTVLERGRLGETYNVGGLNEQKNLDVVKVLCGILDELSPAGAPHERLITYVKDRPGHDRRYAIDCRKLQNELGWAPKESFATGIRKTVQWYLQNPAWVEKIVSGEYRQWIEGNYSFRK
ncbi:MAG TPA: dTDP-glucose 4,6-dehydratase [Acidobacteriaceae bacterium]|nr:dTDP-glucose 4,6-dehydratase [Acidobacteriaceae bacterium]